MLRNPRHQTRLASVVAAFALLTAGVAIAGPAEAGGKQEFVSKREYQAVKRGMTKRQVHNIFGFKGRITLRADGHHPYESRHYRAQWDGRKLCIAVDYEPRNGRWYMVGKSRPFPRQGGCV